MVNARFNAIIASSNTKKKYKHLFLHPYIPIFSVSRAVSFLSSCSSNGSLSLLPSLNLLIIAKIWAYLQNKRLLIIITKLLALLSMATYVRNARKYWKRYLFGAGVFYFVSRYAIKRHRSAPMFQI